MFSSTASAILLLALVSQTRINVVQNQLADAYQNKVLTLRTFSQSSHQEFDENGQLLTQSEIGPWTLYSQVFVNKVELTESRLRLSGVRVIHHRDRGSDKLSPSRSDMRVDIEVAVSSNATVSDVLQAMKNVIVGPETLVQLVPSYWRSYMGGTKQEQAPANSGDTEPIRLTSAAQASKLLRQVGPKYPDVARGLGIQGVVGLQVEINEAGDVTNISIVLPLGAGLDESALQAVSQWKYKPTIVDGRPVRVVATVTVNFAINR
ncbi:MAG TPA: energy transducer TonB [Terriglobia bacterium]|jgi:TonB family protein